MNLYSVFYFIESNDVHLDNNLFWILKQISQSGAPIDIHTT